MRGRAACLAARAAARARAAAALSAAPAAATTTCWPATTTAAAAASLPPSWATRGALAGHGQAVLRGFASSSSASPATTTTTTPSPSTSQSPPPVTLTPSAAARIRELVSRPAAVAAGHTALRLTVEAGGCSGFSYVFALDSGPKPGDAVVTGAGDGQESSSGGGGCPPPTLIIDPVSLDLVRGGTVDFVTELIKAGFEVTANPNADGGCGCGASFTPKF